MARGVIPLLLCVFGLTACINDDLSVCPPKGKDFNLDYSLKLTTELSITLQEEIDAQVEPALYAAVEDYLQTVFTDKAHDVDLHFYDLQTGASEHQESHIINANQASLTIRLPKDEYMHLAVANIANNNTISLTDTAYSQTERLTAIAGSGMMGGPEYLGKPASPTHRNTSVLQLTDGSPSVLPSHATGIFTARMPMYINQQEDQHFDVTLYMANAATVLILDTVGSGTVRAEMQVEQMANSFMVQDSTYLFDHTAPVTGEAIVSGCEHLIYSAVSFPSDTVQTAQGYWQVRVQTWNSEDKRCETVLEMPQPLRAGTLKVIRARVDDTGVVRTGSTDIGVTVTLDWKSGGEHEIEL